MNQRVAVHFRLKTTRGDVRFNSSGNRAPLLGGIIQQGTLLHPGLALSHTA